MERTWKLRKKYKNMESSRKKMENQNIWKQKKDGGDEDEKMSASK